MDEQQPAKSPIDPFLAAKRSTDVNAAIDVDDVRGLRSDWTDEQAADFLQRNAATIAMFMSEGGINAIRNLLEGGYDN